jgi:hypothetical protein
LILIPYKKYYVETEKTIEKAMDALREDTKPEWSYTGFFSKYDGKLFK